MKKLFIGLMAVMALVCVSQVSQAEGPVLEVEESMIHDSIRNADIYQEALIPQVFLEPDQDSDWEWHIFHIQDISYKDHVDILVSGRVKMDLEVDDIVTLITKLGPFVESSDVSSNFYINELCDGVPPTQFDENGEVVCDGETSFSFVATVEVKRTTYSRALLLKFEYNRDESPELSVCEYYNELNGTDYVCSAFAVVNPGLHGEVYVPLTEPDTDGDGVTDVDDNCPDDVNTDQADLDGDGIGDACDPVDDLDGGVVVDDDPSDADGGFITTDVVPGGPSLGSSMEMQGNGFGGCALTPGGAGSSSAALILALMFAPVLITRIRRK